MPQNPDELNKWPQILLDRFCEVWGERVIKKRLRILIILRSIAILTSQQIKFATDTFRLTHHNMKQKQNPLLPRTRSGIECLGEVLAILDAACVARWGFRLDLHHCMFVAQLKIIQFPPKPSQAPRA